MVDVYATGDAECLEPVGSDPSIQAGSAIGDRRVGAARLRTHNTSHITHKLAMKYDGRHTGLHPRLARNSSRVEVMNQRLRVREA